MMSYSTFPRLLLQFKTIFVLPLHSNTGAALCEGIRFGHVLWSFHLPNLFCFLHTQTCGVHREIKYLTLVFCISGNFGALKKIGYSQRLTLLCKEIPKRNIGISYLFIFSKQIKQALYLPLIKDQKCLTTTAKDFNVQQDPWTSREHLHDQIIIEGSDISRQMSTVKSWSQKYTIMSCSCSAAESSIQWYISHLDLVPK